MTGLSAVRGPGDPSPLTAAIDVQQRLITIVGEFDETTAMRVLEAAGVLATVAGEITIDLAGLSFIGSSGLNTIVQIVNTQRVAGHPLWLVAASARTARVFMAGGLAALLGEST
jgi:anti-anti-sigma factor